MAVISLPLTDTNAHLSLTDPAGPTTSPARRQR
jgi:hypothetical protein